MKDAQNITIGLLLGAAVILGAMLLSAYMTQDNAAYAVSSVKQGDYVLGSGLRSSSAELVYLIDIAQRRLNVYEIDKQSWSLELIDSVDLDAAFRR